MKNKWQALTAAFAILLVSMATVVYAQMPSRLAPCYNGVQDNGEAGIDCGGDCSWDADEVLCDGIDDNHNCLIDDGNVCPTEKNQQKVEETPNETKNEAPLPQQKEEEQQIEKLAVTETYTPEAEPKAEAPELASIPAPQSEEGEELITHVPPVETPEEMQDSPEEMIAFLRKLANALDVYLPPEKEVPNAKMYSDYMEFAKKHESELSSEQDMKELITQFSEETYLKEEQKVNIFVKVARFFAGIFG